jgi:hypothetical protein
MVNMDFAWMAQNRDRILAEWTGRYDGGRRHADSAPAAGKQGARRRWLPRAFAPIVDLLTRPGYELGGWPLP